MPLTASQTTLVSGTAQQRRSFAQTAHVAMVILFSLLVLLILNHTASRRVAATRHSVPSSVPQTQTTSVVRDVLASQEVLTRALSAGAARIQKASRPKTRPHEAQKDEHGQHVQQAARRERPCQGPDPLPRRHTSRIHNQKAQITFRASSAWGSAGGRGR